MSISGIGAPASRNYCATIVRVPEPVALLGLDNLEGFPILGHMALSQKGKTPGVLMVAFTAETQLAHTYCHENDLYRDIEHNKSNEAGYLETNRRVRALRLRGHTSNALLMPLESLDYTGVNIDLFKEGDTFDMLEGQEICRKYELARNVQNPAKSKVEKAYRRVTTKQFPEHLETDQYARNKHLLNPDNEVVVTQKLHGTSIRVGRVPVLRDLKLRDKIARKLGVFVAPTKYDVVYGSRKVIKDANNPRQVHHYDTDLWSAVGSTIEHLIPEGVIVYGEVVGYVPGSSKAIQKNYTYDLPSGAAELYVYRVANVNSDGHMSDLSWDGVKHFCALRGLKHVPELARLRAKRVDEWLEHMKDQRFHDYFTGPTIEVLTFTNGPVPLSHKKTVDEGVCLRQEGVTPLILKAKSAAFLEHETKMLDQGEEGVV